MFLLSQLWVKKNKEYCDFHAVELFWVWSIKTNTSGVKLADSRRIYICIFMHSKRWHIHTEKWIAQKHSAQLFTPMPSRCIMRLVAVNAAPCLHWDAALRLWLTLIEAVCYCLLPPPRRRVSFPLQLCDQGPLVRFLLILHFSLPSSQKNSRPRSATATAPTPPSPSAPIPESSPAAPSPACLQLANQCPTCRRRSPTPASRSPPCRWPRSVRRVPNRPADPGLVCAAPAARPSVL